MVNILPKHNIKNIHFVAGSAFLQPEIIDNAKCFLESHGFNISISNSCYINNNNFSGSDDERQADLQKALDNPEIDAILCVRGGYGLIRIINNIDFSGFYKYPKWIMGYSDVTILHLALNNLKIASLHSQMCSDFIQERKSTEYLLDFLINKSTINYKINSHNLNRIGEAEGELIGGNLSIIYSLQATPYEINTENKILFIEDIHENLYHLDRMMYNLRLSGKFDNLKALIVGQFTDFKSDKYFSDAYEVINNHIKNYNFPCCFDFPVGHSELNYPLICGINSKLNVNSNFVEFLQIP